MQVSPEPDVAAHRLVENEFARPRSSNAWSSSRCDSAKRHTGGRRQAAIYPLFADVGAHRRAPLPEWQATHPIDLPLLLLAGLTMAVARYL